PTTASTPATATPSPKAWSDQGGLIEPQRHRGTEKNGKEIGGARNRLHLPQRGLTTHPADFYFFSVPLCLCGSNQNREQDDAHTQDERGARDAAEPAAGGRDCGGRGGGDAAGAAGAEGGGKTAAGAADGGDGGGAGGGGGGGGARRAGAAG